MSDPLDAALVEKVARAICKSRTCEGFECCRWPAQLGRVRCPVKAGAYDDAAHAAIEATALLAERQVRLDAERQLAGCDAVIARYNAAWKAAIGTREEEDAEGASLARHASRSRPSDGKE